MNCLALHHVLYVLERCGISINRERNNSFLETCSTVMHLIWSCIDKHMFHCAGRSSRTATLHSNPYGKFHIVLRVRSLSDCLTLWLLTGKPICLFRTLEHFCTRGDLVELTLCIRILMVRFIWLILTETRWTPFDFMLDPVAAHRDTDIFI